MPIAFKNDIPRSPLVILAVSWVLACGTFLLPTLTMTERGADVALAMTTTGGRWVFPVIVAVVVLLLISRPGLSFQRRIKESLVLSVGLALLFGGGDWANEHLLKPLLGVARPNVVALDQEGHLGMSVESFYSMETRQERADWMQQTLESPKFKGLKLSDPIRRHWIAESGFSLPSGHTLGAFSLLSLALCATNLVTPGWRFAFACLLVPWALAVSYSRVLLQVHWPYDVMVSALAGILIGAGFVYLLRRTLWADLVQPANDLSVPQ